MNFTAVRGYNAYAQFSAKIREAVKMRESSQEQSIKKEPADSRFSDPVDVVTISRSARVKAQALMFEKEPVQTTLNNWMKETGVMNGAMTHRVSGKMMSELLTTGGISLDDDEAYDITIDVWCAVTVTGKNAEKAKAIQDLLSTTPGNINWGLMLQKLPPDSYV